LANATAAATWNTTTTKEVYEVESNTIKATRRITTTALGG
jgi:hypothetical protein